MCIKEITLAFNVSCALCFYGYHLNGFISTIATTEKKTMDDQTLLSFQCECDWIANRRRTADTSTSSRRHLTVNQWADHTIRISQHERHLHVKKKTKEISHRKCVDSKKNSINFQLVSKQKQELFRVSESFRWNWLQSQPFHLKRHNNTRNRAMFYHWLRIVKPPHKYMIIMQHSAMFLPSRILDESKNFACSFFPYLSDEMLPFCDH